MIRTIVLTDIHGCADELMDLFELIKFDPASDKIICLSDLVDKGPFAGRVVKIFHDLQIKHNNVQFVLANHEEKHIRYQRNELEKAKSGRANKIKTHEDFLESRKQLLELDFDPFEWFKSFPLFLKQDGMIFVHAGILPGVPIEKTDKGVLLHVRNVRDGKMLHINDITDDDLHWSDAYQGEQGNVFYGHSPWFDEGYKISKHAIGLDGGVFADGFLACYVLETKQIYKVKARKKYANRFREE